MIDAADDGAAFREANEIGAGAAADVEHALAAIAVEVHEPQQVVQLLEVILIEIGEEARGDPGASADLEIVDVLRSSSRGRRRWWGHPGKTPAPTIE